MNSFFGVERALEVEFIRQVGVLKSGGTVLQQTMLWDANKNEVRPSRTKEGSHDYRYFPEPDLPPLVLATDWIEKMRDDMPELPAARRTRFAKEYELNEYGIDVLTANPRLGDYFEQVARASGDPKAAANWVMGEVLAQMKHTGDTIETFRVRPADVAELLNLMRDGIVTQTAAKKIFIQMIATGDRAAQIAEREGLVKVDDDAQLVAWIDEVLAEMPSEAQALPRWGEAAAGGARRRSDEEVEGARRSEDGESVALGPYHGIERLRQPIDVAERLGWKAEVLLCIFSHALVTTGAQCFLSHSLRAM
jgi:aspartyl-tRNA(Asn)/glutamyl-tRNA(Gln) amidotransferase subunit B